MQLEESNNILILNRKLQVKLSFKGELSSQKTSDFLEIQNNGNGNNTSGSNLKRRKISHFKYEGDQIVWLRGDNLFSSFSLTNQKVQNFARFDLGGKYNQDDILLIQVLPDFGRGVILANLLVKSENLNILCFKDISSELSKHQNSTIITPNSGDDSNHEVILTPKQLNVDFDGVVKLDLFKDLKVGVASCYKDTSFGLRAIIFIFDFDASCQVHDVLDCPIELGRKIVNFEILKESDGLFLVATEVNLALFRFDFEKKKIEIEKAYNVTLGGKYLRVGD